MAKEKTATQPVATVTPETPETQKPAEVQKPVEPTNAKIEELKLKRIEFKTKSRSFPVDSNEANEADIEAWKIGEQIKTEIAEIRKQEAENKKKELRAEKLQLLVNHDSAREALAANPTDQVLIDAAKTAREIVENIILGTVKHVATEGAKSSSNGTGTKGATTAAIRAYARPFYDGATRDNVAEIGKTVRKDLLGQGFNDGTMNQAVLNLERELGLKD